MSDAEKRVRDAFAGVRAPEDLRARTLAAVERSRAGEVPGEVPAASSGALVPVPAPEPPAPRHRRRVLVHIAAAACLVLVLLGAGGTYAIATPTAYVDIEVNPAIELAVNRFDQVVGARALNEDGEAVLSGVDVVWDSCADALDAIGAELKALGYLEGGAAVSVTVTCDDEGQYGSIESACHDCLGGYADEVSCTHEQAREQEQERAGHSSQDDDSGHDEREDHGAHGVHGANDAHGARARRLP